MFFTPRYVKEARHFCEAARRVIRYRLDLLTAKQVAEVEDRIAALEAAANNRDRAAVASCTAELDRIAGKIIPPKPNPGWRENCEVLLVAIVIAAGVRAYLVEPFKIPTGSMEATLNGVVGVKTSTPAPNLAIQAFDFLVKGRTFLDIQAKQDDVVTDLDERTTLNYFTSTDITCQSGDHYTVFAPAAVVQSTFGIVPANNPYGYPGTVIHKGDHFIHGYANNGDFVLVNKLAYNFWMPSRADVFVFRTAGIAPIEETPNYPKDGSEHYIKRIGGIPGDQLQIKSPKLFVNGHLATEIGFQRVMSQKDGYRGYSNPPRGIYLTLPDDTYTVPANSYFALGDNSYDSFDSRYWGPVPQQNIAGKAFVAFWPITNHWGFIK